MSDRDLIDAVAHVTGEDSHEIRRYGLMLTGPKDSGPEPECLLDVLLVDLPETWKGPRLPLAARGRSTHGGASPVHRPLEA